MRMPEAGERLVGKVCVCSVGRPFIVTHQATFDWGLAWAGLGLDGKGTACSSNPCIIAECGQEFHDKIFERFGGKMSFNS